MKLGSFTYKCTPDKSMTFKSESCQGGKISKDRVTVMIGSVTTSDHYFKKTFCITLFCDYIFEPYIFDSAVIEDA